AGGEACARFGDTPRGSAKVGGGGLPRGGVWFFGRPLLAPAVLRMPQFKCHGHLLAGFLTPSPSQWLSAADTATVANAPCVIALRLVTHSKLTKGYNVAQMTPRARPTRVREGGFTVREAARRTRMPPHTVRYYGGKWGRDGYGRLVTPEIAD